MTVVCVAVTIFAAARRQDGFVAQSQTMTDHLPDPGTFESAAARLKALLYDAPQARVRALTRSGPPVDLMLHHGGAYSARERARLEGRIRDGAVLVLLDSHADLMDQVGLVPRPATIDDADRIEYDIASHIVPSLADGLLAEVIHVGNPRLDREGRLPGHVPGVRQVWVVRIRDRTGVEAAVLLDGARPTPATALARLQPQLTRRRRLMDDALLRARSLVVEPVAIAGLEVRRVSDAPVTIRTTFPDDLPDLSGTARSVVLDVDEDFFALGSRTDAPTEWHAGDLARDVARTVEQLAGRGIRPGSVSIALSPGYTPEHEMAPVAAALLGALERTGISRFARLGTGDVEMEMHERGDGGLLEIRAARAMSLAAAADDSRTVEALALCDSVIARYGSAAAVQQGRGRARSVLARSGNPDWPWQPSPVISAQHELNAVGEAYALRSRLLARVGRRREALDDLVVLRERFADAHQPVAIRELSPGFGWIVGQGWRRSAAESADP